MALTKSLILKMLQKFKKHLSKSFPALKDQKILLALSGGVDSCVLLDLCIKSGLQPAVAHCNFQLRGKDNHADADWIKNLAKTKNLKYYIENFDPKSYARSKKVSIQMAARDLRYEWFDQLSNELSFDFILVAHHTNDALETFMINAMRGTGLRGLLGIPERRGKVLRPMLPFSREDIMQYAQENKIKWREDSSNAETYYLRNALRHEVIPLWKKRDPNFDKQFQETLKYLGRAQAVLDEIIEDFKNKNFIPHHSGFKISIKGLEGLSVQDYYLHALFAPYGFRNTNDLKQMMQSQSGKQLFSASHRLVKDREDFLLNPTVEFQENTFYIDTETSSISLPIQLNFSYRKTFEKGDPKSLLLDKQKLKFPLTLRKWKQSDYFYPNGLNGKKKLSKYFKDEKFSLLDKESQWLLCSGEDIVWVIGKRADQRFLADEETKEKCLIQYDD